MTHWIPSFESLITANPKVRIIVVTQHINIERRLWIRNFKNLELLDRSRSTWPWDQPNVWISGPANLITKPLIHRLLFQSSLDSSDPGTHKSPGPMTSLKILRRAPVYLNCLKIVGLLRVYTYASQSTRSNAVLCWILADHSTHQETKI